MPVNREKQVELSDRRRRVADLYVQGVSQTDIAIRLGVNQGTISRDLQAVEKEWAEQRVADIDQAKRLQLEKIDRMEREAWNAWEKSKGPLEINRAGVNQQQKGRAERITKTTAGDPRMLLIVDRCIERRCKILGLEAPVKTAVTDTRGNDVPTDQRVAGVLELLGALRERAGVAATREGSAAVEPGVVRDPSQQPPLEDGSPPGTAG